MNKINLTLFLIVFTTCTCGAQKSTQESVVLTVDQLINDISSYASKNVNVRGEVIMDYHGRKLCDKAVIHCFQILLPERITPKPDFKLEKDHLYDKYKSLSTEIGLVERSLGKARLFATIRARFDILTSLPNGNEVIAQNPEEGDLVKGRFILKKVLTLDVQNVN